MRNESRRVWSLQVEEGGTVQEVLRRQAGFTKKEISRAKFLPDGIRKNGIRCRVTEKTLPGDIIEILLETETQCSGHLTANTEVLDILYEDQDLLAVNKPAGVVTHPQGGHYEDTLANQVSAYYASAPSAAWTKTPPASSSSPKTRSQPPDCKNRESGENSGKLILLSPSFRRTEKTMPGTSTRKRNVK